MVVFARSWALWIVFVPLARLKGSGGVKGAVLPSHSPLFQHKAVSLIWSWCNVVIIMASTSQFKAAENGERHRLAAEKEYLTVKKVVSLDNRIVFHPG